MYTFTITKLIGANNRLSHSHFRRKGPKNIPDIFDKHTWELTSETKSLVGASDDTAEVHIGINHQQAAHPDMAVSERRKRSLLTLPYGYPKAANELYEAGCFYSGKVCLP